MILGMDHFTIVTNQLETTRRFYVDLIGLQEGPRPPFPVDGLWLYANGKAILHVISVDTMPNPRRGVLDHMAFSAQGFSSTLGKLDQYDVRYRIIRAMSGPGKSFSRTQTTSMSNWISIPLKRHQRTGDLEADSDSTLD